MLPNARNARSLLGVLRKWMGGRHQPVRALMTQLRHCHCNAIVHSAGGEGARAPLARRRAFNLAGRAKVVQSDRQIPVRPGNVG
jgi:hypothetical protein